jgi:hypothetical protein
MEKPVKRKDEGASYELHMAIWYLLWLSDDTNGFYDFKFGVQLQVHISHKILTKIGLFLKRLIHHLVQCT